MNRNSKYQLKVYKSDNKTYFYKIKDSDSLMNITSQLYGYYNLRSNLYLFGKTYYLELEKHCLPEISPQLKNRKYLKGILEEYGKLISKNAVCEIGSKIKDS